VASVYRWSAVDGVMIFASASQFILTPPVPLPFLVYLEFEILHLSYDPQMGFLLAGENETAL